MWWLVACEVPDDVDAGEVAGAPDPWDALVAEAALHFGFEAFVGGDEVVDDSPSGLAGVAWGEDDVAARVVAGPRGQALTFDGEREFVYVADADVLDLAGEGTLLAWMRADPRDGGPRAYPILDKYAFVDGAWTGYAAYLDGAQPYAGVYAGVETGEECGGPAIGVFDDGEWHLYAATFDGEALAVTVDGVEAARCAWSRPAWANGDFLEVGTRGGEYFFRGALDDVTVVPRALSGEEIAALL
ncbi:MAG: LamG domain-containing protein [Myxococcota bacterium]